MTIDHDLTMIEYGRRLAVAGASSGCPLLTVEREEPANVFSIEAARTRRAIAQCRKLGLFSNG